jgi:hypothetical protein
MKRIILIVFFLVTLSGLNAQTDTTFYKHEVKVSASAGFIPSLFLLAVAQSDEGCYATLSFSYLYRPYKWLWVGGSFVNFFGDKLYYNWREYYPNGNYRDYSKSKLKYFAAIAPEVRFSMLNTKYVILYGALSVGIGIEDGYDNIWNKYPKVFPYFHVTCFGINGNFGKNQNIFVGGEVGIGYRGHLSIHGGYRF